MLRTDLSFPLLVLDNSFHSQQHVQAYRPDHSQNANRDDFVVDENGTSAAFQPMSGTLKESFSLCDYSTKKWKIASWVLAISFFQTEMTPFLNTFALSQSVFLEKTCNHSYSGLTSTTTMTGHLTKITPCPF